MRATTISVCDASGQEPTSNLRQQAPAQNAHLGLRGLGPAEPSQAQPNPTKPIRALRASMGKVGRRGGTRGEERGVFPACSRVRLPHEHVVCRLAFGCCAVARQVGRLFMRGCHRRASALCVSATVRKRVMHAPNPRRLLGASTYFWTSAAGFDD